MTQKVHRNSLQPGYHLHWYHVQKILGQGGFGITYLALDRNLAQLVAIKEYLPIELAVRDEDSQVYPLTQDHTGRFQWGLERFIDEARTLAKFRHPNIVRVRSVFEENHTAYMVMDYEEGENLQDILNRRKTLEEDEIMKMLIPILGGLGAVHAAGFVHRDIKPANLLQRVDGSPVLLDFGSARKSLGERTRSLTSVVTPGYSPFEQYRSKSSRQGPWTDIYGLGATLYRCISGVAPMDAIDRSDAFLKLARDTFVSAVEVGQGRYSGRFLRAVDHALRFDESERPQSVAAWRAEFEGAGNESPAVLADDDLPTEFGETLTRGEVFGFDDASDHAAARAAQPAATTDKAAAGPPAAAQPAAPPEPRAPAPQAGAPPPVAATPAPITAEVDDASRRRAFYQHQAWRPALLGSVVVAAIAVGLVLWLRGTPEAGRPSPAPGPGSETDVRAVIKPREKVFVPLTARPDADDPVDVAGRTRGYLEQARLALARGEFDTADDFIDQALRDAPDATEALHLRRDVRKARQGARPAPPAAAPPPTPATTAAAETEAPLAQLLAEAEEHLRANRLTSPPERNAFETYEALLRRDAGNAEALAGMQAIVARYLALVDAQIAAQRYDRAETYLERAAAIDAGHPGIAPRRAALDADKPAPPEAPQLAASPPPPVAAPPPPAAAPIPPTETVPPPVPAPARIAVRLQGFSSDYERHGLSRDALRARVIEKLSARGWQVVSLQEAAANSGIKLVDVVFRANLNTTTGLYSYSANVMLKPAVDAGIREAGARAMPIWSVGTTGVTRSNELRGINAAFDALVDNLVANAPPG